jgi:hypothetical protein
MVVYVHQLIVWIIQLKKIDWKIIKEQNRIYHSKSFILRSTSRPKEEFYSPVEIEGYVSLYRS